VGISEYAASALGDVIYVELPAAGTEVGHGDAIGAVESVKSASDIMTPVAGTVVETNEQLEEKPALLNKSPESDAWIAKIEIADGEVDGIDNLMDAEAYKKFTDEVDS
jgi:glycine cleavage system H protein